MHRQNSTNQSDGMANDEDIIKCLTDVEENSIAVTFVSDKWNELPKSTTEQMTDVGLCQRIATLEAKFERYNVNLTDMCVDVIINKDKYIIMFTVAMLLLQVPLV